MKFEELFQFIESEHKRLMDFYGFEEDDELKSPIALKVMKSWESCTKKCCWKKGFKGKRRYKMRALK